MKRFFAFFLLIFIIGLACSFVPLSLRFRFQRFSADLSRRVITNEAISVVTTLEKLTFSTPTMELSAKAQATSISTAEPEVIPPIMAEVENDDEFTGADHAKYTTQMLTPTFTTNFANLEAGCDWVGIAGQVFTAQNNPLEGMLIIVKANKDSNTPENIAYSGLAPAYGPGGYEIVLGNENLGGEYLLQLFDQDGHTLSKESIVKIPAGCESNLTIINFIDQTKSNLIFFPLINQ